METIIIIIIISSTALGGPWPPHCMEISYNKVHPNSQINMEKCNQKFNYAIK
jgi:hypothetical protein